MVKPLHWGFAIFPSNPDNLGILSEMKQEGRKEGWAKGGLV